MWSVLCVLFIGYIYQIFFINITIDVYIEHIIYSIVRVSLTHLLINLVSSDLSEFHDTVWISTRTVILTVQSLIVQLGLLYEHECLTLDWVLEVDHHCIDNGIQFRYLPSQISV